MKIFWTAVILLLSIGATGYAADRIEAPADCKLCGMNRTTFAKSRMVVTYSDGSTGTCSINCAVTDLKANKGKEVKSFQVGDYNSKKLINAKTATWVIGGKKKGVMTPDAKWAFVDKSRAEKFIKVNGGKLASFAEVLKATENEQAVKEMPKEHGGVHRM